jgi:hypothetical protein
MRCVMYADSCMEVADVQEQVAFYCRLWVRMGAV